MSSPGGRLSSRVLKLEPGHHVRVQVIPAKPFLTEENSRAARDEGLVVDINSDAGGSRSMTGTQRTSIGMGGG